MPLLHSVCTTALVVFRTANTFTKTSQLIASRKDPTSEDAPRSLSLAAGLGAMQRSFSNPHFRQLRRIWGWKSAQRWWLSPATAWPHRARVVLLDPPALELPGDTGTFDRFVAAYVFDLLSPQAGEALLGEAARLLVPGGLLGVVSLTKGTTISSRIVSSGWEAIAKRWPSLLGGCQPIELRDLISGPEWAIEHCDVAVKFGVPSEVVIARLVGG